MDKEKFRNDLDFDVKIRLAGALCTAVCIVCRQVLFPDTSISVVAMMIPVVIATLMGIIKVVAVPMDNTPETEHDVESSMEEFKKEMAEYDRKNRTLGIVTDILTFADVAAVVAIMVIDK